MTNIQISGILNTILERFAVDKGYDLIYEATAYTPTIGKIYLEIFYLPGEAGTQLSGNINLTGVCQVNINVPAMSGRGLALQIIDDLIELFGRKVYVKGKGRLGVSSYSLGSNQTDGQWLTEILNLNWQI